MIFKKIRAFIEIMRPGNGIMAIVGVILGSWLSDSSHSILQMLLLALAAFMALSFGNVINDIKDLEGDKINHPHRPLPQGMIQVKTAYFFSVFLFNLSLLSALLVSQIHFIVTLIPLIMLILYTLYFKAVPLFGNLLVSLLVAYTLVFGALKSNSFEAILLPSVLAFILNMEREIIKDFQDREGDLKTGIKTTATLSSLFTTIIFFGLSFSYLLILPLPAFTEFYSKTYLIIAMLIVLPLHLFISSALLGFYKKLLPKKISKLIKLEMLLGLSALTIDKILN